jgi:DHA1 family bicyclomycin/chloramphenicol resistance-like MFS transporter
MDEAVLQAPAIASHDTAKPVLSPRFVLALSILLGCFAGLGPLAIDMYLPSFKAIANQFGATIPQVERTLTAYLFGLAIGQLFYGPAADRYGRKRPLYVGLTVFVIASAGCAFATSVRALLLLRCLQALGGCAEMVIARAIVRDLFDDRTSVRVFSSLMLVMGVAPIVAPLVGGFIVGHFGWQVVFWVLVGAGAICFMGAVFLLPESLPPERRQTHSISEMLAVYRRVITHRIFIVHTLTLSLACAALFSYVGGSPGLFIDVYRISPQHFGIFFGANAFCLIMMSQVSGYLAHRVDPRKTLGIALTVSITAAVLLLAAVVSGWGGLWTIFPCLFVFLGTFGFIFPNTTVLAMSAHGAHAGNASALLGFFQFFISAIGGIIVTNLPLSGPLAMAVMIAGCMGAIPIIRTVGRLALHERQHDLMKMKPVVS